MEAATVILEVIPNFEERTTYFLIKKDRFGLQGAKVSCGFDKGRYVLYTDEFKKKVEMSIVNNVINKDSEDEAKDVPHMQDEQKD